MPTPSGNHSFCVGSPHTMTDNENLLHLITTNIDNLFIH